MIRNAADIIRNIPQTTKHHTWKIMQSKNDPELFMVCWRNNTPLFTFRASDVRQSFQFDFDDFEELKMIED